MTLLFHSINVPSRYVDWDLYKRYNQRAVLFVQLLIVSDFYLWDQTNEGVEWSLCALIVFPIKENSLVVLLFVGKSASC